MEELTGHDLAQPRRELERIDRLAQIAVEGLFLRGDDRGGKGGESHDARVLEIALANGQGSYAQTSTVAQSGELVSALLTLQRPGLLSGELGSYLVQHELMHALGFGHTCAWHSVLAEAHHCPAMQATSVTPSDVAYLELLYALRTAGVNIGASLAAALRGASGAM